MSNFTKLMAQAAAGAAGGSRFYPYTVDNSARFNEVDNPILYRTQGTPTDQDVWTLSCWIKRADVGSNQQVWFSAQSASPNANYERIMFRADAAWRAWQCWSSNTNYGYKDTTSVFRDPSSWAHYVVSRSGTTITAYVNGVEQTLSGTAMTAGQAIFINQSGVRCNFGSHIVSDAPYDESHAYFSEAVFIDGQALTPTSFGQLKNGIWVPEDVSGLTFGNNGFYLDFSNSSALGTDVSGNGNNFTSSGLTSSDQVTDTPTNNFCTWNPNTGSKFDNLSNLTADLVVFSNGNLNVAASASPGDGDCMSAISIMAIPDGVPIYAEFTNMNSNTGISVGGGFQYDNPGSGGGGETFYGRAYYIASGSVAVGFGSTGTVTGSPASFTTSDIIGVRVDKDNQTLKFYKNNVLQATVSSLVVPDDNWYFQTAQNTSGASTSCNANWGQLPFTYSLPADHLALCTANLPEPPIGSNIDENSSGTTSDENFNVALYTGNGTSQSITGAGFQPDLIWIKNRTGVNDHWWTDVLRGTNFISSTSTNSIYKSIANCVTSFDSDGFSVGSNPAFNGSGSSFVSWNWKFGGSGVSNTNGSLNSTVSVNSDAGMCVGSYTGNGVQGATVGHGLGVAPAFVHVWRDAETVSGEKFVYHAALPSASYYLNLSSTAAQVSNNVIWAGTSPTSSVFSIGNYGNINGSGSPHYFYAFAEVEGFSSFGSYTGNGSAEGPMIYTGFRPAFVIVKQTNVARGWYIFDSVRDTYNAVDDYLRVDDAVAEANLDTYDFLSNGFKLRQSNASFNQSGGTYIYMAFAENPFKYANAR